MLKKIITSLCFLLPLSLTAAGSSEFPVEEEDNGITWFTSFSEAQKASKSEEKPLFVLFTGSDWCGWCKKLEGEALSTAEFGERAKDRFTFVKLDYPRKKPMSNAQRQQNQQLKIQYGVRGFPTVMLFDSEMRKIAQTGYQPGGGASYAEHLLKLSDEHQDLKRRMARFEQSTPQGEELEELFEMTRRLGEEDYQQKVLSAGIEQKNPYFLLERYQQLQQQQGSEEERASLRALLAEDRNPETQYRLAIIDYVRSSFDHGDQKSPDKVAAPLVNYLSEYGAVDRDNAWRVQLQVATLYKNAGDNDKALNYLQRALQNAPDTHRGEVKTAMDALTADSRS